MKKMILMLIIFFCCSCNAQQKKAVKECYKTSWAKWIENELPESICVSKNEMIYHLFDEFDFNNDGLIDVAIKLGNKDRKNGDLRKLCIYQKVNDSTFTKFREFDNIYPLWFEDYHPDVKVNDPKLDSIKEYYEMGDPLKDIDLVDNKIMLVLKEDAVTECLITFTYSNEKKDWLLTTYVEYNFHNNTKNPYPTDKIGTSISEFSYIKYLNGEY
ncbi:hypothetical protein [Flagellimonas aequoris]|uniref:EF-hand domain-containing protein n=1 Tax=Flagellimonas aequoris TaxID=2306997 RepID=A0A418N4Y0_9FLAO|nr:hypothetical protein [Allomuricauda aequoris]RIV68908.1 hypothetical protein D2U88_17215 [Allomuricauda aequoris]TXK00614.1 hypothetical protein FQ019_17015 [Allomuricauda aequoris]